MVLSSSDVEHHTMSKRIRERKTEGESAEAKPRSVCFISTNLNREQSSSFGPDASNVLVNLQLDSRSVQRSCGNLQRNRDQNPATLSQKSCEKLQRGKFV